MLKFNKVEDEFNPKHDDWYDEDSLEFLEDDEYEEHEEYKYTYPYSYRYNMIDEDD